MENRIDYKKKYTSPQIVEILIDNEIALALDSTPPNGYGEPTSQILAPDINNIPFKV